MEFKSYRKITPTVARVLTELDYDERGGIVETNEGKAAFLPGDYLARDTKGAWPIGVLNIRTNYRRLSEADEAGYVLYQPLSTRLAAQMVEPFEVDGLIGKAGDYLVKSANGAWPVDREIFEAAYALVEA